MSKRSYEIFLVCLGVGLLLALRKPDALINPQFWAEDAVVFFKQQYVKGSGVILEPSQGYYRIISRAVASIADIFLPYSLAPLFYNLASLALALVVVINIYSKRFNAQHKYLLALAIALVPHYTSEVFLNITNSQWIIALLLVIVALKDEPSSKYGSAFLQKLSDSLAIIFCGLNGPFIIFIAPVFIAQSLRRRTYYSAFLSLLALATTLAEINSILSANLVSGSNVASKSLTIYTQLLGQRFFGNLFLGIELPYQLNEYFLLACLALLTVFLLLSCKNRYDKGFMTYVFIYVATTLVLATFLKDGLDPNSLLPAAAAPRYFYIPYVMLCWSLILCLKNGHKYSNALTTILLLLILRSSIISGFVADPFIDYQWSKYSNKINKVEEIRIPVNPEGWSVTLRKK